jgi:phosphoribosylanthranilate isomerase
LFRIKICGITNVADAHAAVQAGADAIGLNFYAGSPRFLEPNGAEAIVEALPDHVVKVGVFVNSTAEKVLRTCERLGLDLIQLHGDEPPELLAELAGRPVMRALPFGAAGIDPIVDYVERCLALDATPQLILLDADRKGAYGGTGQSLDWQRVTKEKDRLDVPLILAGGLTSANVAEAIRIVRPAGVDTASGVEAAPGRKDLAKLRDFVAAAAAALNAHP